VTTQTYVVEIDQQHSADSLNFTDEHSWTLSYNSTSLSVDIIDDIPFALLLGRLVAARLSFFFHWTFSRCHFRTCCARICVC